MASETVSEEVEIPSKIQLGEENLVWFQRLDMNNGRFMRKLRRRVGPKDETYRVVENKTAKFMVKQSDGTPDRVILTSEWHPLGLYERYQVDDNTSEISWVWSWHLFPGECAYIKEYSDRLPEETDVFKKPIITSPESMVVSYLFAAMTNLIPLEHVYVCETEESSYLAFGMKNIQWGPVPGYLQPIEKSNLNTPESDVTSANESSK